MKNRFIHRKTIDTGFEFLNNEPLKKIIDLGKFLWKEKFQNRKNENLNKIPTGKIERASNLLKAGAKVGVNYIKYYGNKITKDEEEKKKNSKRRQCCRHL